MSYYRITVTKCELNPQEASNVANQLAGVPYPYVETEVFRQMIEELNLSKFVLALNKQPRVRKARVAKSA